MKPGTGLSGKEVFQAGPVAGTTRCSFGSSPPADTSVTSSLPAGVAPGAP
eukprot:CAMPEP_0114049758 /NCGR_PEP_ID=MMETSP1339-20121228/59766_1 /TAXON_ID=94617 /ORGANISM="Fibrocapsa japonica" /LENGTH=49 /assembly_acc=CAM_ASM_000762